MPEEIGGKYSGCTVLFISTPHKGQEGEERAEYLRQMGRGSPALSQEVGTVRRPCCSCLLYSGHCVSLRQPPPWVEGCVWLEPVLMGPKLRGLFKEKGSDSVSHSPNVPGVICPCLSFPPSVFSPVCRPGSFVLEETREKRSKPPV